MPVPNMSPFDEARCADQKNPLRRRRETARDRRERRRRAEARLRFTLVKDGFLLASHRGNLPATKSTTGPNPPKSEDPRQTTRNFAAALEAGDHRQATRCWNILKRLDQVPSVPLVQAIESMQRFKKDPQFVLRE